MRKSGTSDLVSDVSTACMNLLIMIHSTLSARLRPRLDSVGSTAKLGLFLPPLRNGGMIAAHQHFGNLEPPIIPRPRVLRVLDPPRLAVRFVRGALLVSEHSGNQANDGLYDHHSGNFAAVADEVADRDLGRFKHLADAVVEAL